MPCPYNLQSLRVFTVKSWLRFRGPDFALVPLKIHPALVAPTNDAKALRD